MDTIGSFGSSQKNGGRCPKESAAQTTHLLQNLDDEVAKPIIVPPQELQNVLPSRSQLYPGRQQPSSALEGRRAQVRERTDRRWLIDLLKATKPDGIFLVTIWPEAERELTLSRIADVCDGWQPDDCFFSTMKVDPPTWKRHACQEMIFPKYGANPDQYLAVESNLHTQKMYTELGIRGFKVFPVSE